MKLNVNSILNIYHTLGVLADRELDLNTACSIAKNIKEIEISKSIIDRKRDSIITEYAKKDENGNLIPADENGNIQITNISDFYTKMDEILNTELEIKLEKISRSAIKDIKISPKDILPLMDILTD